jgi:hypothetical protein
MREHDGLPRMPAADRSGTGACPSDFVIRYSFDMLISSLDISQVCVQKSRTVI